MEASERIYKEISWGFFLIDRIIFLDLLGKIQNLLIEKLPELLQFFFFDKLLGEFPKNIACFVFLKKGWTLRGIHDENFVYPFTHFLRNSFKNRSKEISCDFWDALEYFLKNKTIRFIKELQGEYFKKVLEVSLRISFEVFQQQKFLWMHSDEFKRDLSQTSLEDLLQLLRKFLKELLDMSQEKFLT